MDDGYKLPGGNGFSLNSGWGYWLMRGFFFITIAVTILGGYAVGQFRGLGMEQSMEYAEVARNLADGNGFVTRSKTPFDVWFLQKHGKAVDASGFIPEVDLEPGYPVVLSWIYRVMKPEYKVSHDFGISDAEWKAVVPLGVILTLLTAAALYWVGRGVFGERVAWIAVLVYLVSNLTLSLMISGLPVPLLSLLVTLACGLAMRCIYYSAVGGHPIRLVLSLAGAGLCVAGAILTNYAMVAVFVGGLVLLGTQLQRFRWGGVALFGLVVVLVSGVWLAHNQHAGLGMWAAAPYRALHDSILYPDNSLDRCIAPNFNSYRVSAALRHKMFSGIAETLDLRDALAGGLIICFFVLAVFRNYTAREGNNVRWFTFGVLVLLLLLSPLLQSGRDVLPALFPLVVLLGVSAFINYVDREDYFTQGLQSLLVGVLVAVSALPAAALALQGRSTAYPPYYAPLQNFVASMINEDEAVLTDVPHAIAWYGGKGAILVPSKISDVTKLGCNKIGGVYLTQATKPIGAGQDDWYDLFYQNAPQGFSYTNAIELPSRHGGQIFLSDRPRWQGAE